MKSECSPERITELACAGDAAALEEVTRCYLQKLLVVGRRACRDEEAARDAVQDTLLTAAERLDEFRGDGSFDAWLRAIVVRACARQRRGMKNDGSIHSSAIELAGIDATPELEAFRSELGAELRDALADLSEEERAAVLTTQVEELSGPEAAARLGVEPAALRKRLSRARAHLRDRLAHLL
jgi:RNA polymerase sigma-70 factor (ECF subfamily)